MEEPRDVNFRVAGRAPRGAIRKAAMTVDAAQSRPSIPSKLETILYKGDRESLGFGSKDLRFMIGEGADAPGPGQYGEGSKGVAQILAAKEGWSKRGTGTFASVTRRFPHQRLKGGPGPGFYGAPMGLVSGAERMPSSSFAQKLDLPSRVGPKPQAPGPGEYVLKKATHGEAHAASSAFKSKGKRGFAASSHAAQVPGPGQYAVRSASAPHAGPRDCKAAFALPTDKASGFVRVHPDLPMATPNTDPDGSFAKPRVASNPSPGPGQYSIDEQPKEYTPCVKGNSAFIEGNSAAPRKAKIEAPGPGSYSLPPSIDPNKGGGAASCFAWKGERGVDMKAAQAPGPAYYDQMVQEEKKSFHLNIRRKWV